MKSVSFSICKVILVVVLLSLVFMTFGCTSQPGETAAEGSRRHDRVARINQQELMEDIDTFLLIDQPSKLTDKRVP